MARRLNVRRTIIREWMSLARQKRQSREQATVFVRDVLQRHDMPKSRRMPFDIVMAWLVPRTGKA
jgi:hypothetical protein